MSRIIKKVAASLAALSLLATVSLVPVSAAAMVPHKSKVAGNFAFVSSFQLQLDGTGHAAHLGEVTSSGVITFLGNPDAQCCIPLHDEQTLTSVDTGERLTIALDGQACPTTGQGDAVCFGNFDTQTFSYTQVGTVSRPDED